MNFLSIMNNYVCPPNVVVCMLNYIKSKDELQFSSAYNGDNWKDVDFVIFPIFDSNGSADALGYGFLLVQNK